MTGRTREVDEFVSWMSERTPRHNVILYTGIGGMGKSSLLTMISNACVDIGIPVARIDVAEQAEPLVALVALSRQLGRRVEFSRMRQQLERYRLLEGTLRASRSLDGGSLERLSRWAILGGEEHRLVETESATTVDIAVAIERVYGTLSIDDARYYLDPLAELDAAFVADVNTALPPGPACIFVDTYEQVSVRLEQWLTGLARQLDQGVVLVLAGRTPLGRSWEAFGPVAHTVELEEMTIAEARQLFALHDITDESTVGHILALVGGLPLGLKLCIEASQKGRVVSVNSAVRGSVIEEITRSFILGVEPELRDLVELCATLHWFHRDMLVELRPGSDMDLLFGRLSTLPFVRPHTRGLAIHDRVRDFINDDMRRQRPLRSRDLNRIAADYFKRNRDLYVDLDHSTLNAEFVYHSVRADEKEGLRIGATIFNDAADSFQASACDLIYCAVRGLDLPEELRLWVDYFGGVTAKLFVDLAEAERLLRNVLDSPASHMDSQLRVYAGRWLAGSLWFSGSFKEVIRIATETRKLSAELVASGNPAMVEYEHRAIETIGLARDRMGDFAEGVNIMLQLTESSRRVGDRRGEGWGLLSQGYFSWHSGDWDTAVRCLEGCLRIAREIKSDYMEVYPLGHLGLVHAALGQYDSRFFESATEYLNECKRKALPADSREMDCKASQNLAQLYAFAGELDAAETHVMEAVKLAGQMAHPYYEADSRRILGEILLARGNGVGALEAFRTSVDIADRIQGLYVVARSWCGVYQCAVRSPRDTFPSAASVSEESYEMALEACERFPRVRSELQMWRAKELLNVDVDVSLGTLMDSLHEASRYNRFMEERLVRFVETSYGAVWEDAGFGPRVKVLKHLEERLSGTSDGSASRGASNGASDEDRLRIELCIVPLAERLREATSR
ncbi:tetratricopeptide repeat protein [Micromonospora chalcea]